MFGFLSAFAQTYSLLFYCAVSLVVFVLFYYWTLTAGRRTWNGTALRMAALLLAIAVATPRDIVGDTSIAVLTGLVLGSFCGLASVLFLWSPRNSSSAAF